MGWIVPLLVSSIVNLAKMVLTQEVFKRVFIDMGWHFASKDTNALSDKIMNTVSQAAGYGYKPELDK